MSITEDVCGDHPFIMDVSSDYFPIKCNLIIGVTNYFLKKFISNLWGHALTNIVIVVTINVEILVDIKCSH